MMAKTFFSVVLLCTLICGCATQRKCLPDRMPSHITALDITPEIAFSNALVVAQDAFNGYRIEVNREKTLISAIEENGDRSISIEIVTVYSKLNSSLKGVLFDLRVRSGFQGQSQVQNTGQPNFILFWELNPHASSIVSDLSKKFLADFSSRFSHIETIEIDEPQADRRMLELPEGIKIVLNMPPSHQNQEAGIDVLGITFESALNMAYETALSAFPSYKIDTSPERNCIQVLKEEFGRQIFFIIEPRIIQSITDSQEYGILFRYSLKEDSWVGGSATYWDEQQTFEKEFWRRNSSQVKTKWIPKFRFSYDQGVPEKIASSIPTSYEGFKRYLDGRKGLLPFEGIWTEAEGLYTLGIIYVANDPRFKFHAFIIETRRSSWQPGEIKAKFSDLKADRIVTGDYRIGSKALFGMSWKVRRDLLEGVSSILGQNILFIRTYPSRGGSDLLSGVGTAWAVTDNGVFITAAHVVEGASKLFVGFKDKNPQEATVLVLDQKLDLAIIKTKSNEVKYRPLPILNSTVENGVEVTALGYPLAFDVGDDIKVTGGIISSQSGVQRDVTTYQISAPVQAGNSGGPIVDKYGNAIGVVVAQIDDASVGTDAELVNYAVKSPYVQPLLDVAKVQAAKPQNEKAYSTQVIAEMYRGSVLPIWTED